MNIEVALAKWKDYHKKTFGVTVEEMDEILLVDFMKLNPDLTEEQAKEVMKAVRDMVVKQR
jgi:hypothetical protein